MVQCSCYNNVPLYHGKGNVSLSEDICCNLMEYIIKDIA